MAEQTGHDVVNQTLSGGDPSPSGVPASTNDKISAGGDAGENEYTISSAQIDTKANAQRSDWKTETSDSPIERNEAAKDSERSSTDIYKHSPGPVASRALELNGVASTSDGDDTASQGGSESDASRADGRGHVRAGSTKKPATFKPVSFAKFSVPKAPGTPTAPKPSDKAPLPPSSTPLGAPQPTSRPRLVAKTTSSLRDSISKTGTGGAKPAGVGPDPNQVWNRNRPAQPTPPKHLTDEELKQQYGIHMTSRIQEDGGGTEAKWADIDDDDEDDWAPETIEWTDGTKTSLTQNEPTPAPVHEHRIDKELKPASPPPEQVSAPREAPKIFPKPTTSVGPNPTVLRLGANAERQAKSASVSPMGTSANLYPSSTSPAPPTKSPWAPIPPVAKMSPVTPPVQVQPQSRAPVREHPTHDSFVAPPPPKEIAADDFNRSWREIQPGGPRELFNSRSGRYEPVPETRKGSWRSEQQFRAPSVLQRPTHHEQMGPAEPSPAFQTRRSSIQDGGHWTRRRTSSNVSGGSGAFSRRMSIGRADMPQKSAVEVRRGSQVNGMLDKDSTIQEVSHTRQAPGQGWQRRTSVNVNEATTDATGMAPPSASVPEESAGQPKENPVAMQERIMKEKRMEARQRRIEQEEKEEAAKRERIRQKLEALGPAPERPRQHDSPESSKPEPVVPAAAAASQSPPKPPVPEPTGAPKQYGMMKVHHPDSVKRLVAANDRERTGDKGTPMTYPRRLSSPPRETSPEAAIANGPQQFGESPMPAPGHPSEPRADEQGAQWKPSFNVPGPYSPWSSNAKLGGTSPSLTNPWKPLSNDRTLGNGIFEQSLGGFPTRDLPLRSHFGLDPSHIAPSSQPFPATSRSPQEAASISPLPSPEVRHTTHDSLSPIGHPGPIGPPSSQPSQWQQDVRPTSTAAWNNFHAVAAKREAEESERIRQEMNAMRDTSLQVSFNETWRQVGTGDQAGQRQVIGINRPTESAPPSNPLPGFDHPVGSLPFADSHARPFGSVAARSSRFFPPVTEQPKRPAFEEDESIRSLSPPPPEEISSHPAFTGDSSRPLVHLPGPKPVVKLPPQMMGPPPPPPTFASMAAAPPRSPHPVSTAMSWQEKINGLFGKKTLPEKRNALAVASASKEPLDDALHVPAVSVSFPRQVEVGLQTGDGEMTAMQVEEGEAIFEDREAGSLPVVRVPNMAPPAAWLAAPRPPQSRLRGKNMKQMQVHSIEPYSFGFDRDSAGHIRVSIRFPGAILAKSLALPKKGGGGHYQRRGLSHFKSRKGPKSREGSGNFKKPAPLQQANGGGFSGPTRTPRTPSGPRQSTT